MAHKEADLILDSVEFEIPDLSAMHIPGIENWKVHIQSQRLDSREWASLQGVSKPNMRTNISLTF